MLIGREYNFHAKDPFAAKCKRLRNRDLVWKEKLMSGLRRCQRLRHGRPAREQDQSPPPCASRLVLPPFTSTDSSFTQEEEEERWLAGWRRIAVPRGSARERAGEGATCRRREPAAAFNPSVRTPVRARKEGSEPEGLPSHHCSNQDNTFSAVIVAAAAAM